MYYARDVNAAINILNKAKKIIANEELPEQLKRKNECYHITTASKDQIITVST